MAGEARDDTWPLPKFYFSVRFGDDPAVKFQEVTGLAAETTPIQYRHGNSPSFYPIKMPGLGKVGNVTLRKGVLAADSGLFAWFDEIKMNSITRRTVVVSLLDETGAEKMVWTLGNAFPVKISGLDLASNSDEAAVETMELAFETLDTAAP